MKTARVFACAAGALALATMASATPTLQFDLNGFNTQAANSSGTPTAFGGLMHTGSVNFSVGSGVLAGMFAQTTPAGAFVNLGLSGFTLTGMTGQVNLSNGMVTGGNITITLNNGDNFVTQISPASGAVSNFVGGGFKIQALTTHGLFNDATFGNVDVSQFFAMQSALGGLPGSFLQFNFQPNAQGFDTSDMDLFVQVIPLPPAAFSGLASLAGLFCLARIRRR